MLLNEIPRDKYNGLAEEEVPQRGKKNSHAHGDGKLRKLKLFDLSILGISEERLSIELKAGKKPGGSHVSNISTNVQDLSDSLRVDQEEGRDRSRIGHAEGLFTSAIGQANTGGSTRISQDNSGEGSRISQGESGTRSWIGRGESGEGSGIGGGGSGKSSSIGGGESGKGPRIGQGESGTRSWIGGGESGKGSSIGGGESGKGSSIGGGESGKGPRIGQDEYGKGSRIGQDESGIGSRTGQVESATGSRTGQDEFGKGSRIGQSEYGRGSRTGQGEGQGEFGEGARTGQGESSEGSRTGQGESDERSRTSQGESGDGSRIFQDDPNEESRIGQDDGARFRIDLDDVAQAKIPQAQSWIGKLGFGQSSIPRGESAQPYIHQGAVSQSRMDQASAAQSKIPEHASVQSSIHQGESTRFKMDQANNLAQSRISQGNSAQFSTSQDDSGHLRIIQEAFNRSMTGQAESDRSRARQEELDRSRDGQDAVCEAKLVHEDLGQGSLGQEDRDQSQGSEDAIVFHPELDGNAEDAEARMQKARNRKKLFDLSIFGIPEGNLNLKPDPEPSVAPETVKETEEVSKLDHGAVEDARNADAERDWIQQESFSAERALSFLWKDSGYGSTSYDCDSWSPDAKEVAKHSPQRLASSSRRTSEISRDREVGDIDRMRESSPPASSGRGRFQLQSPPRSVRSRRSARTKAMESSTALRGDDTGERSPSCLESTEIRRGFPRDSSYAGSNKGHVKAPEGRRCEASAEPARSSPGDGRVEKARVFEPAKSGNAAPDLLRFHGNLLSQILESDVRERVDRWLSASVAGGAELLMTPGRSPSTTVPNNPGPPSDAHYACIACARDVSCHACSRAGEAALMSASGPCSDEMHGSEAFKASMRRIQEVTEKQKQTQKQKQKQKNWKKRKAHHRPPFPGEGSAPLVLCRHCLTILRVPERLCPKAPGSIQCLQCGACSRVLKFSLH